MGELNLMKRFMESPAHDLLTYIFMRVHNNINIGQHSYMDLKIDPADFRNLNELLRKSKYLYQ